MPWALKIAYEHLRLTHWSVGGTIIISILHLALFDTKITVPVRTRKFDKWYEVDLKQIF